jgi:hypothetical protein
MPPRERPGELDSRESDYNSAGDSKRTRGIFCEQKLLHMRLRGAIAHVRAGDARARGFDQSDHLQGRNDLGRHRARRVQRPRRRTESHQNFADAWLYRARPDGGNGSSSGFRTFRGGVAVRACRKDRRKEHAFGIEVSAHCGRRQLRSDRCDREVQGRNLFEVQAPHRHLLASWWCSRMADRAMTSQPAG